MAINFKSLVNNKIVLIQDSDTNDNIRNCNIVVFYNNYYNRLLVYDKELRTISVVEDISLISFKEKEINKVVDLHNYKFLKYLNLMYEYDTNV